MRKKMFHINIALLAVVLVGGLVCHASATSAATDPVTVAFATTGTPAFGATVSVQATVTVNDGSTLQSMAWSQAGGAAAVLAGTDTDTVSVTLGTRNAYRHFLIEVLGEPPSASADEEEFFGGLQNRFEVVGINPLAEEHASATVLEIAVTTTSGTYHAEFDVVTPLPWPWATGLRNVPVGLPVLLHGKTQATYNWALAKPTTLDRGADRADRRRAPSSPRTSRASTPSPSPTWRPTHR